jgi:hypothetical protein
MPTTLLNICLLVTVLVTCVSTASAQTPTTDPPSEVLQSCLLGTPDEVWVSLKLTVDQRVRMRHVQEACKEECDVVGVAKQDNPISNADGSTIMSEVDNILSTEQYRGWVAYCVGSGTAK